MTATLGELQLTNGSIKEFLGGMTTDEMSLFVGKTPFVGVGIKSNLDHLTGILFSKRIGIGE